MIVSYTLVIVMFLVSCSRAYIEMAPVLRMLNLHWEGECPMTSSLRLHPELQDLGWTGRCPTIYRVLQLPTSSEPQAILAGYCDPSCHNVPCSPLGNFRCRNHTVEVDVTALQVTELGEVVKVIRTEDVPIGCVCRSNKYTRLGSYSPLTVE